MDTLTLFISMSKHLKSTDFKACIYYNGKPGKLQQNSCLARIPSETAAQGTTGKAGGCFFFVLQSIEQDAFHQIHKKIKKTLTKL